MGDEPNNWVFLNNEIIPTAEAGISIFDAGILHGAGLFETMRAYGGRVFRVEDHIARLLNSSAALALPLDRTREQLVDAVKQTLAANELRDARLRLTVTSGKLHGLGAEETPSATVFVTASPLQPYPDAFYQKGMTAIISNFKLSPTDPTVRHKTIGYLPRLMALQAAHQGGAGEAIWFTTENRLAEGSISNIFLVKDGKLSTPSVNDPLLPGITRKVVIELAAAAGIAVSEGALTINDLLAADEVFITNSVMEVMPVCRIERHGVGNEEPGPITQRLAMQYREGM